MCSTSRSSKLLPIAVLHGEKPADPASANAKCELEVQNGGPGRAHGGNHRWQAGALEASTAHAVLVAPRLRITADKGGIFEARNGGGPDRTDLGELHSRGLRRRQRELPLTPRLESYAIGANFECDTESTACRHHWRRGNPYEKPRVEGHS
jgi:hypothetical protein